MGSYPEPQNTAFGRRVTLSRLKEEQFALNMRMLYAMQLHDEAEQAEIQRQMEEVREEIRQLLQKI